jgi:hypothetical protein
MIAAHGEGVIAPAHENEASWQNRNLEIRSGKRRMWKGQVLSLSTIAPLNPGAYSDGYCIIRGYFSEIKTP